MGQTIDKDVLDMAKAQYRKMVKGEKKKKTISDLGITGLSMNTEPADEYERDKDGFIVLKPTQSYLDNVVNTPAKTPGLTTSIDQLENKLNMYMSEKKSYTSFQDDDSDDDKKKDKKGKKKRKKMKEQLLAAMFNDNDGTFNKIDDAEPDDDTDEDDDSSDKKKKKKERQMDTLESTYGTRFAPIVSYIQDAIDDFDDLADTIESELKTKGTTRGVYRSSQMANLISAKNSKLSAVKELTTVAKMVSDLELKKAKEESGKTDSTETVVAKFGTKFLSGSFDDLDDYGMTVKHKKKTKGGGKKKKYNFMAMSNDEREEFDDEDYDDDKKGKDKGRIPEQKELAKMFAEKMISNKTDFKLTPHEKNIRMEGKYEVVVVVEDILSPAKSWKFTAVDKKGREIEGFRKEYKELLPNKKSARMVFDMNKMKATNKSTNLKYRILVKDD